MTHLPPSDRFEHGHTDLASPLNDSQGYKYLCTFTDRTTHWIEAIPLKEISAETVAKTFVEQWVCRYGVPIRLTTDRGPQYTSALFEQVTNLLGAQHIKTTSYHPQANGMMERFHRRLKEAL